MNLNYLISFGWMLELYVGFVLGYTSTIEASSFPIGFPWLGLGLVWFERSESEFDTGRAFCNVFDEGKRLLWSHSVSTR